MMDLPIDDLMDEDAWYRRLRDLLHPGGLRCPRCGGTEAFVHRHTREPVLDYRCKGCGAVYNAFTGTDWHKTHCRPNQVVRILPGSAQGPSFTAAAIPRCFW
jgi:hypothetical protein